ncbi:STT3 [Lepeophtheirus salmonis]|uniref:dolichyl-diphosphooligosaccharide--protein glycotransferase n=1 Tax=Lepeophtheirus salmonis TaxID=72036 RepID=A0A7R8GYL1_LEPSM|nr:STT3 [Lepeophtheirus salmonis]CAF2749750.1 STT3 [Lepeophtheirus salmonis]
MTVSLFSKGSPLLNPSGSKSLIVFIILALAWIVGFSSRLFAVIRFESIIHEFDPWFNYRCTAHMVKNVFEYSYQYSGRVCVFLAPLFSGLTAISTYLLTQELWSQGAGLFAACFISIVPGYISRSVAGSYDNEGIAIFALMFTYFLWIKSVKTGSIYWPTWASLSYFYMVSAWGGYIFLNVYMSHTILSSLLVSFAPCKSPLSAFNPSKPRSIWQLQEYLVYSKLLHSLRILGTILAVAIIFFTWSGVIAPWSGRFYSLWDTGYAKIHIPIIASVSEHQPTPWFSFFFDLHILVCVFPVGLCRLFCGCYAFSRIFELYLKEEDRNKDTDSEKNMRLYDKVGRMRKPKHEASQAEEGLGINIRSISFIAILTILMMFAIHCTWVTANAYSSPSIVLASYNPDGGRNIVDDFREAYYWLWHNTDIDATVMSWWDYGYQIAGLANRTTLVDNNTWNNSHIALVGKAMSSNESDAYKIMTELNVDYVLVIFGGVIGYAGDDINKFLWMVRIAEGEHPNDIRELDYFTERGEFRVDAEGAPTLLNCLMYKLSYYRFGELKLDYHSPPGYDRTRSAIIGNKNFKLTYLEEAYTSEHWLVRIYRVKKPHEFNRPKITYSNRKVKTPLSRNGVKQSTRRKKGSVKNKPTIVKGRRK